MLKRIIVAVIFGSLLVGCGGGGGDGNGDGAVILTSTCINVGVRPTPPSLWTQLNPSVPIPLERAHHTAVYDQANDRMIIFGGKTATGLLNDVWVLSSATGIDGIPGWVELKPTGGPPPARERHVAAYDAVNNMMIIFGGIDQNNLIIMDLWVLTNANGLGGIPTWTHLSLNGGPSPRSSATGVYDAANNRLIFFGGVACPVNQATCNLFNEVWVLSKANGLGGIPTWSQITASGSVPSPRRDHAAVYDATNNKMIVFGGNNSAANPLDPSASLNDTWVLSNANGLGSTPGWSLLSVSGSPPARRSHTGIYDAASNRLIIFGGAGQDNFVRNDVWILTNANDLGGVPAWAQYSTGSPIPKARVFHTAIYSLTKNRMVIFGGDIGNSTLVDDAWVLRNANGIPSTPIASISIISQATTICATNTLQLTAVAKDSSGNTIEGVLFLWVSSDKTIATVDDTGLVTGKGAGTVIITASSEHISSPPFNVTITPPPTTLTLTITKSGTGTGTVTSSPAGINCGAACSSSYNSGTSVTLTATPDAGSTFAGWSGGGCIGTGTCTVTMSAATTVTANFNVTTPPPPPIVGGGPKLSIPTGQGQDGCLDTFNGSTSNVTATTLVAWGGAPVSGYTWTLSSGSTFPAGTTVESLTGIFKGTGSAPIAGTHTFNMTVSDGSTTATGTFTFTVNTASSAPSGGIPGIGCGSALFQQGDVDITLPNAKAGAGYGAGLFVTLGNIAGDSAAGKPPLTWSLGTGNLPVGLVIDQSRGVVRGTPALTTVGQTFSFTITVKGSTGKIALCRGICPTYKITVQ